MNTKQEEEEALIECTKRFEQAQDDIKSIVGTEWSEKVAESTEECKSENDSNM